MTEYQSYNYQPIMEKQDTIHNQQSQNTTTESLKQKIITTAKKINEKISNIQLPRTKKIKNKMKTTVNSIAASAKQILTTKNKLSSQIEEGSTKIKIKYNNNNKTTNTTKAKTNKNLITIINVYAPYSQLVKDNKENLEQLYTDLDNCINSLPSSSMLIIARDFNSKIGKNNNTACIGRFSRGTTNESGQHLINLCESQGLFVSNTSFQHPAKYITPNNSSHKLQISCSV